MNMKIVFVLLLVCVIVEVNGYKKKPTSKPKPPATKPPATKPPTTKRPKPPAYPPAYSPSGSTGSPSGTSAPAGSPMPYKYEYSANVGSPDPTGQISAQESGDANGVVTGSYMLVDPDGRQRTVIYRADSTGFHATVQTNELPPDVPNPADVVIVQTGTNAGQTDSTSAPSGGGSGTESSGESGTESSGGYY